MRMIKEVESRFKGSKTDLKKLSCANITSEMSKTHPFQMDDYPSHTKNLFKNYKTSHYQPTPKIYLLETSGSLF